MPATVIGGSQGCGARSCAEVRGEDPPRQGRTARQPLHQHRFHFESQARVEPLHLRGMPGHTRGSLMREPFSKAEKLGDFPDPFPQS